jgi:hypothetical protein
MSRARRNEAFTVHLRRPVAAFVAQLLGKLGNEPSRHAARSEVSASSGREKSRIPDGMWIWTPATGLERCRHGGSWLLNECAAGEIGGSIPLRQLWGNARSPIAPMAPHDQRQNHTKEIQETVPFLPVGCRRPRGSVWSPRLLKARLRRPSEGPRCKARRAGNCADGKPLAGWVKVRFLLPEYFRPD